MTTIILTSTVNVYNGIDIICQREPNSRIQTYLSSVLKWLHNTKLNVVLVENSGYNFNELNEEKIKFKDRFEVIVFDETNLDECIKDACAKGVHEMFAINYAFFNSKLLGSSNFIIKITARFFIPEFEEYLNNHDLNNWDCLVQNDRNRCEVVGSHVKNFSYVFEMYTEYDNCVEMLWKDRTSKYDNILVCKIFQIDETQRGGADQPYRDI